MRAVLNGEAVGLAPRPPAAGDEITSVGLVAQGDEVLRRFLEKGMVGAQNPGSVLWQRELPVLGLGASATGFPLDKYQRRLGLLHQRLSE